jgi:hypothetical protein
VRDRSRARLPLGGIGSRCLKNPQLINISSRTSTLTLPSTAAAKLPAAEAGVESVGESLMLDADAAHNVAP